MADVLTVRIEGFATPESGIARVDGRVVFVEGACPEDVVRIEITKKNKSYANAKVLEIIKPSPYRVKPFCVMQKVCGACQLQFIDYNYQLELKRQIVQDAVRKIGGLDIEVKNVIKSPEIIEYRHKIQYPVSQKKVSKRILAGYYKTGTHELVNIKHCPIQPKICDGIIDYIKEKAFELRVSGYDEKTHSGDLRHIIIRNSAFDGENLVVLVVNASEVSQNIKKLAVAVYEKFSEVSGVCVNFNTKKTNVIQGNVTKCISGKDFVCEKLLGKSFKIGANTFFQINPKSAENIFKYVKEYISSNFENPTVLDAYAGISAFGICVSDVCEKVVSVEENAQSCKMAADCLKENVIENVEINNMDAGEFFAKEKRRFDVIILDPPRKGCTKESLDNTLRLSKGKIIYVSCNPATLARDLKYMAEKGAQVVIVQPFDMFCHTYHIETVAIVDFSQSI